MISFDFYIRSLHSSLNSCEGFVYWYFLRLYELFTIRQDAFKSGSASCWRLFVIWLHSALAASFQRHTIILLKQRHIFRDRNEPQPNSQDQPNGYTFLNIIHSNYSWNMLFIFKAYKNSLFLDELLQTIIKWCFQIGVTYTPNSWSETNKLLRWAQCNNRIHGETRDVKTKNCNEVYSFLEQSGESEDATDKRIGRATFIIFYHLLYIIIINMFNW